MVMTPGRSRRDRSLGSVGFPLSGSRSRTRPRKSSSSASHPHSDRNSSATASASTVTTTSMRPPHLDTATVTDQPHNGQGGPAEAAQQPPAQPIPRDDRNRPPRTPATETRHERQPPTEKSTGAVEGHPAHRTFQLPAHSADLLKSSAAVDTASRSAPTPTRGPAVRPSPADVRRCGRWGVGAGLAQKCPRMPPLLRPKTNDA